MKDDLLKTRICDLGIRSRQFLASSKVKTCVSRLHNELEGKGINFKPRLFLGDEWFSPEGMAAISIPFYLADADLVALERKRAGHVEGHSIQEFMMLLRHETGHCVDHVYRFSAQKKWKNLFGRRSQPYRPERYLIDQKSKNHVRYLPHHYAQAHPDEDFAETFAVWLDPNSKWQTRYRHWPYAWKKLQAIDEWIGELNRPNFKPIRYDEWSSLPHLHSRITQTLEAFYKKRGLGHVKAP